jgi:hypothetical protein
VREAVEKLLARYSVAIRDVSIAVDAESNATTPVKTATAQPAKRSISDQRRGETSTA